MEKRFFFLALISLGLGGFFAFLVALARTPGIYKLFPPAYFYHALVGHVDLAIVIFLLSFTMLLWNKFLAKQDSISFYLAFLGFLGIAIASFSGKGVAVSNNYLPTIVHPVFFAGVVLFFSGLWFASIVRLKTAIKNIFSKDPLINSLSMSIVLAFMMLLSTITSAFKTGSHSELYLFYERLYWAPGHIHQFLNGTVLLFSWYFLSKLLGVKHELGILRFTNLAFLTFGVLLVLVPVIFEDPVSRNAKIFTELSYAIGLGIPIFLHMFNILKRPVFNTSSYSIALWLSILLYLLGVVIAYAGLKADLRVPAHYHGAVTSLTLTLMAISYYLLKEYGWIKDLPKIAKPQLFLYGFGMILFVLGLYFAGFKGAPRKTYGTGFTEDPFVLFSLGFMMVGTVLAVISGVMFVVYTLRAGLKARHANLFAN
ncbi:cbb3-type cytochrome c oxidase subunit I [Thermocrinis jamiesonii]|uniref:cbb3-type cytochrome c oxidase subunit I n=1 Tax=Thermocrinis jamiesonii TaxID=1302351 RepID=UPI0004970FE0|nr:cbb3-type cytochrome c oxidase subunit I [Thermocrinis jamiesonii]